ncbi:MAG TPA: hypothetical protein VIL18_04005 [Longimicrobiales bacterium]
MGGKQMEGDSRYRRRKAREARKHGKRPSAEAATLGASKQRHHVLSDPHVPDVEKHEYKLRTIREGKQKVIRENTPEPRPRSLRPEHPMTRHKHL